jgi:hypothetical protein
MEKTGMKQIYEATGNDLGGKKVDTAFENHMKLVLGGKVIETAKDTSAEPWLNFMTVFQQRKKGVDPKKPRLSIEVPYFLHNVVSSVTGGQAVQNIIGKDGKHGVTFTKGNSYLYFNSEATTSLFEGSVSGIVKLLKNLLKRKRLANVLTVLMVGGYSECQILQEEVKETVKEMCQDKVRVIVPPNSSLCVLRGAVAFGHNPAVITTRVARMSYGIVKAVP